MKQLLKPNTVVTPTGCIGNRRMHNGLFHGPWYVDAGEAHSPLRNIKWDLLVR